jgi:chaperonin GroEL
MSMRPTKTLLGKDAQEAIIKGVSAIYEPVKRTLGPQGKSALLYRTYNRGSRITDDGVTVADCQEPKNAHIRLVAQAFKEMCKRTVEKVGDGTTTTAVIGGRGTLDAISLLQKSGSSEFTAKKRGNASIGVMTLRRAILATAAKVKVKIKEKAQKVTTLEQLEQIATISVKDVELGKVVAKMAWDVGIDGHIDVVEGYKGEIETEVIKGFRFPAKPGANAFINKPERFASEVEDCHVLVTNWTLDNAGMIGKVFQKLNENTTKIVVIAPNFSDNVLINMVNASKAGFEIIPVKAPSLRTDQFDDLCTAAGARFIDKNKGDDIRNVVFRDLGFCKKIVVKGAEIREDAVMTGGRGSHSEFNVAPEDSEKVDTPVTRRIETLKKQLEETREDVQKKLLERRIASMASAVGIIRVGDSTQAEALYRKLKLEDAVYACKAGLRGGFVKGGGLCLKEIVEELELPDDDILKSALLHPYELIQGSVDGGIEITDDVIDPADAVFYAVEHASGVMAQLITVDVITPEMAEAMPEEGNFAIANSLVELGLAMRQHFGLIQENEVEMERDRMKGLSVDELIATDTG